MGDDVGISWGDTLYSSARTLVRRATDPVLSAVVVKSSASAFPSSAEVARLRREFEMGRPVEISGLVRHHADSRSFQPDEPRDDILGEVLLQFIELTIIRHF